MARQTDPHAAAPRTPLSKERVLRAAIELADAEGIDALSMRRLAKELGVEAMSLYNHVANKGEILGGIIDLVAGEFDLPSDESDWKLAMRRNAISSRDVLLRHRWATSIWMSQGGGPARLRNGDWMLRTLREAGFPPELIYHAFHILESYVLGYTLQQLNFPYKGEELADLAAGFLEQIPVEEYPDLVEHIHQHIEPHDEETSGFEMGLDLILDGLDRARATV
jgi:AcrR family transcriptional regulator